MDNQPTQPDPNQVAFDTAAKAFIVSLFSPVSARDSAWEGAKAVLALHTINGDWEGANRALAKLRLMTA